MNACCVTANFPMGKGPGLRVMGKHVCRGHDSVTNVLRPPEDKQKWSQGRNGPWPEAHLLGNLSRKGLVKVVVKEDRFRIRVVSHCGGLSSGWSFFGVVSSWWIFTRVIFYQGGHMVVFDWGVLSSW